MQKSTIITGRTNPSFFLHCDGGIGMIKPIVLALTIFTQTAAVLNGQEIRTTPTPAAAVDEVVKISTDLIRIDVSVTDKNRKPVVGLDRSMFEIFENGEKQKITTFAFVSASPVQPAAKQSRTDVAVPAPMTELRPEHVNRTIALIVDDLSMSSESIYYTKRGLRKFVDQQMQPGDLVAIIRTGAGIGSLQRFTSDKNLLHLAIEKIKWNLMGVGGMSAVSSIKATPMEALRNAGDSGVSDSMVQSEKNSLISEADNRGQMYAGGTLGTIGYVVKGISDLPGRKLAILFSDGFQLVVQDRFGIRGPSDIVEPLRRLIDSANRNSVVVYTVDPRGLQYTGINASDNLGSARNVSAKLAERRKTLFDSTEGLFFLSKGTGGFSVQNQNDLNLAIDRVLEDQSYYLIGYEPDSDTFDPAKRKFNTIDVKVRREGVNVRFRTGFFNIAENKPLPPVTPAVLSPIQAIERALYSPFSSTGIDVRINSLFGSDATDGSFVRSLLHIDAEDLIFIDSSEGQRKAELMVLAASFDERGAIADQLGKTYTISLPDEMYKKVLAEGFVYYFKFPIKTPGAYQYRVAIRDMGSGRIGSAGQFVLVPDLGKQQLVTSSLVIENISAEQWTRAFDKATPLVPTNPLSDTALRRVKVGSVLKWGMEIYNSALNGKMQADLRTRVRVFQEGKLILDGEEKTVETLGQPDVKHLRAFGAVSIGSQMPPGDYILQVIVNDRLAKPGKQVASQHVQFEVLP